MSGPLFQLKTLVGDEERMTILCNGRVVADLNHDSHGWDGMEAATTLVQNIADRLGGTVERIEVASESEVDSEDESEAASEGDSHD